MKLKQFLFKIMLLTVGLFASLLAQSQAPNDAIMMPSKNVCVLANYDFGSFNQYWEGALLRENQTIATVQRTTVLPMAAIGIFDNLNLYIGTPYVKTQSTQPNGGYFAGANGFQDLGLALKYEAVKKKFSKSELSILSTVGFSVPMTNYLSDYMPYSLGFGAPELGLRGIVQYKMDNGLFFRTSVAHLWRGYTKTERDFYYSNGIGYYTPWMDVPNAWNMDGVVGMWLLDNALKIELNYTSLKSTSGDDIRPYNAPQPTNKVMMDRVGIFANYYLPSVKGLGVLLYHQRVLNGLNTGKTNSAGVGITYQFDVLNKNK